jgi:hypothetical protein
MKATISAAIAALLLPLPAAAQWATQYEVGRQLSRPAPTLYMPRRQPVTINSVMLGPVRHTTVQTGLQLQRCYGVNLGGIDHTRCN